MKLIPSEDIRKMDVTPSTPVSIDSTSYLKGMADDTRDSKATNTTEPFVTPKISVGKHGGLASF